jgi:hypothetical protein
MALPVFLPLSMLCDFCISLAFWPQLPLSSTACHAQLYTSFDVHLYALFVRVSLPSISHSLNAQVCSPPLESNLAMSNLASFQLQRCRKQDLSIKIKAAHKSVDPCQKLYESSNPSTCYLLGLWDTAVPVCRIGQILVKQRNDRFICLAL